MWLVRGTVAAAGASPDLVTGTERPQHRVRVEPIPTDPDPGPAPDRSRTWPGVLSMIASGLLGAAAGCLAIALSSRARAYCDAGWEAGVWPR